MSSEAETMGKQAVLAWKVDRGTFNGVSLDGLSVVAARRGRPEPRHRTEIGGDQRERPLGGVRRRSAPTRAQQLALVAMANELSKGTVGTIVQVTPAPIQFADQGRRSSVPTNRSSLAVNKVTDARPDLRRACSGSTRSCRRRRRRWAWPSSTRSRGSSLGTKWSDPNKRSAFFGTFSY